LLVSPGRRAPSSERPRVLNDTAAGGGVLLHSAGVVEARRFGIPTTDQKRTGDPSGFHVHVARSARVSDARVWHLCTTRQRVRPQAAYPRALACSEWRSALERLSAGTPAHTVHQKAGRRAFHRCMVPWRALRPHRPLVHREPGGMWLRKTAATPSTFNPPKAQQEKRHHGRTTQDRHGSIPDSAAEPRREDDERDRLEGWPGEGRRRRPRTQDRRAHRRAADPRGRNTGPHGVGIASTRGQRRRGGAGHR
jgi:hypothetical protein